MTSLLSEARADLSLCITILSKVFLMGPKISKIEREKERERRTCVSAFRGCLLRCGDRLDSSIIMHGKMLHFMVPGTSDHKNEGKIIL